MSICLFCRLFFWLSLSFHHLSCNVIVWTVQLCLPVQLGHHSSSSPLLPNQYQWPTQMLPSSKTCFQTSRSMLSSRCWKQIAETKMQLSTICCRCSRRNSEAAHVCTYQTTSADFLNVCWRLLQFSCNSALYFIFVHRNLQQVDCNSPFTLADLCQYAVGFPHVLEIHVIWISRTWKSLKTPWFSASSSLKILSMVHFHMWHSFSTRLETCLKGFVEVSVIYGVSSLPYAAQCRCANQG